MQAEIEQAESELEDAMRVIKVQFTTRVPARMTDGEIQAWLEYALTERGELPNDNPMSGCGPEPFEGSIRFGDAPAALAAAVDGMKEAK